MVSNTCKACGLYTENLLHLFALCPKLTPIHNFLKDMLHNIFIDYPPDVVNLINYEELMIFGYLGSSKIVNTYFLNFFLSIARLCIFKTRNLKVFHDKEIDTVRLFKFTISKYIEYAYTYYKIKHQQQIFDKYFLRNNSLLRIENDKIILFF